MVVMSESIEVKRTIGASPDRLYVLLGDLTRMGEWAPENRGGRCTAGAKAAVGATFRGRNQIGWRRWTTTSTVTEAQPGQAFSFVVTVSPLKVAEWGFRFAPVDDDATSTVVTQSYHDDGGRLITAIGTLVTGVRDRATHNRVGLEKTLAGLAAVADAEGAGADARTAPTRAPRRRNL